MFEMWAKRKDDGKYEYVMSFEEKKSIFSMLEMLDNGKYEETIIMQDKNYVMMKIYEKGKTLKK